MKPSFRPASPVKSPAPLAPEVEANNEVPGSGVKPSFRIATPSKILAPPTETLRFFTQIARRIGGSPMNAKKLIRNRKLKYELDSFDNYVLKTEDLDLLRREYLKKKAISLKNAGLTPEDMSRLAELIRQ